MNNNNIMVATEVTQLILEYRTEQLRKLGKVFLKLPRQCTGSVESSYAKGNQQPCSEAPHERGLSPSGQEPGSEAKAASPASRGLFIKENLFPSLTCLLCACCFLT